MANGRIGKVEDVLNVGDEVDVVVLEVDDNGKVSLDRMNKPDAPEGSWTGNAGGGRNDRNDRGGHGNGGGYNRNRPHHNDRDTGDDRKPRRRH